MREYQRTTRECTIADWQPEVAAAVRDSIKKLELGAIERENFMCCETVSRRIKLGFLSRLFGNSNAVQHTGILLTSEWLIWATTDGKGGASSIAARLSEIRVKDYASSLIEDCGLEIFGFVNQSPKRVQAFVGLGREPAAEQLRLTLKAKADWERK